VAILLALFVFGFVYVADQPVCRTEASEYVDPRCDSKALLAPLERN